MVCERERCNNTNSKTALLLRLRHRMRNKFGAESRFGIAAQFICICHTLDSTRQVSAQTHRSVCSCSLWHCNSSRSLTHSVRSVLLLSALLRCSAFHSSFIPLLTITPLRSDPHSAHPLHSMRRALLSCKRFLPSLQQQSQSPLSLLVSTPSLHHHTAHAHAQQLETS